ncbi:putative integral er membrane protein [Phaeomoniella chlamydospora]|uniref:Putative integral er membrane protein n=1 Tax=Phaeomoniella chlamydospora TaxID=158046 RepID=A0A0G2E410_PHACM|nr:putative integral er membrane protein [Phaeomoniella chlamydospora]
MSVELQPSELGFKRPFNHEVTEVLKITNTNSNPVAFKVKTTAPKQYCVRPNSGLVPPNGNVEVQVLLQAMKEDPPLDAKCRDKFLVQSVLATDDAPSNVAAIWQTVEKTGKSAIQEKKIRVNFLPADSGDKTNGVAYNERRDDSPPAYTSPSSQYGSPAQGAAVAVESKPAGAKSLGDAKASSFNPAAGVSIASAAAAVKDSVPTSSEELKQQLADAKAQISKLTGQLSDPGLRQRKVQQANEKVQQVVQQSGESGVPLQIVAGLCLLSFLLAYFFF